MVICVGCPMQPLLSPTVRAQRTFSGSEWYLHDAMLAVKQAIGRCIRHAKDYGAIVLLDDRYVEQYASQLPPWALPYLNSWDTPEAAVCALQQFFDRFPKKQVCVLKDSGNNEPLLRQQQQCAGDESQSTTTLNKRGLSLCGAVNVNIREWNETASSQIVQRWDVQPDKTLSVSRPPSTQPQQRPKRGRDGLYDTALKLLCESVDHTSEIDRDQLENMFHC